MEFGDGWETEMRSPERETGIRSWGKWKTGIWIGIPEGKIGTV